MQIGMPPASPRNGQSEPHHLVSVESTNDLSSNLLGNDEQTQWDKLGIAEVPNFFLQCYASPHFVQAVTLADSNRLGAHRPDFSCCFDCCHKDSRDRKSTRLNSSHRCISYAGFC